MVHVSDVDPGEERRQARLQRKREKRLTKIDFKSTKGSLSGDAFEIAYKIFTDEKKYAHFKSPHPFIQKIGKIDDDEAVIRRDITMLRAKCEAVDIVSEALRDNEKLREDFKNLLLKHQPKRGVTKAFQITVIHLIAKQLSDNFLGSEDRLFNDENTMADIYATIQTDRIMRLAGGNIDQFNVLLDRDWETI